MTVEELNVILTAKASNLKSKIKSTNKDLHDVAEQTKRAGLDVDKGTFLMDKALNKIDSKGAADKIQKLNKNFKSVGDTAQKAGSGVGAGLDFIDKAVARSKLLMILKIIEEALRKVNEFTSAYGETESAQSGLNSILTAQGKSVRNAKMWLMEYTRDGLIPLIDAYAAYKNLSSAEYTDAQTQSILKNLKDASAYGRQGNLSMGDAVKSATEGIKNENSVLVDNAGVSKNLSIIWEEYAVSVGKSVNNLTEEEKRLATVNGLMRETAYQTGNAAEYASSFGGAQAVLKAQTKNLSSAIGSLFAPALKAAIPYVSSLTEKLAALASKAGQVMAIIFGRNEDSEKSQKITQHEVKRTNNISKSWDKATKAAKAYQSRLLGIDEIHRLGSQNAYSDSPQELNNSSAVSSLGDFESPLSDADKIIDPKIAERAEKIRDKIDKVKTTFKKFAKPFLINLQQLKQGGKELYEEGIKPLFEAVFGVDWDFEPDTALAEYIGSTLKWALIDVSDILGFIADLINGDFSGAWEHLKDLFWDNRVDDFSEKLDILKGKFESVKTKVKDTTDSMKEKFSDAYEDVSLKTEDFYNNKVAPWFTKEKWDGIFYNVGVSFGEKVNSCVTFWNETLPSWWSDDVKPWFTKEKWKEEYDNMKTALSEKWDEVENTWNTKVKSWYNNKVSPWFTKAKWQTLGKNMKDGIVSGFEGAVNGLVGILNRGIGKMESWANNIIDSINDMIKGFNSVSVIKADYLKPVSYKRIPAYKYGGFPEEGPFYMNKNEIIGKFSNGRTAVANSVQIIEGIKSGVVDGIYEALSVLGAGRHDESQNIKLSLIVKNEHGDLISEINDINMKAGRPVIPIDL